MVKKARGYTMVALLMGLMIMSVVIATLLPLASAEAQRDREEELIFRGTQYAEGIRLFRRRYGRYPNALKEMLDLRPRTLRKLWKDPITDSNDWGIVSAVAGAPLPGQQGGGATRPPGSPGSPLPTPTPAPTAAPTPSAGFGSASAGTNPAGPVAGVYSTSKKKGYRVYQGREAYNEWRFTEQTLIQQTGAPAVPGPGVPN
jgi:type II secretory pathway pseudopilin PulG